MTKSCLSLCSLLLMGAIALAAGPAFGQQAYPTRPIRIIVPYPSGGGVDPVARLIGSKLSESLGQSVIVDNRPGGNTIIGVDALAKSAPDGHTIGMVAVTHVTLPHLMSKLPFDVIKDFAPIASIVSTEMALVLNPSVPATSLGEFIALAKSKPGQLTFASSGTGSPTHLAGEMLNAQAGTEIRHIPYKGGAPAMTDLLGGQVNMYFSAIPLAIPHVASGKIRGIAVTGDARHPGLPQVPTFEQAGLPGFEFTIWYGLLAPAGTPKPVIDRLSTEIGRIMAMSDVKEKVAAQGNSLFYLDSEQFARRMDADMAKYAKLIKSANIKMDN